MNAPNKKAARSGVGAAFKTFCNFDYISTYAWRVAYTLEDCREKYSASRRVFGETACCVGLWLLRGGR